MEDGLDRLREDHEVAVRFLNDLGPADLPQGSNLDAITGALVKAGASVRSTALVGSHATRYTLAGDRPVAAAR